MAVVLLFLAIAWSRYDAARGAWCRRCASDIVVIHVVVIFTAVAALIRGRRRGASSTWSRTSSSSAAISARCSGGCPRWRTLDKLVCHAVLFGLPFLSMGIVAGVIRAETFRRPHWWRDAVVLLAVAAWVIYAGFACARLASGWSGRRAAWLAVAGLVCLLAIRLWRCRI